MAEHLCGLPEMGSYEGQVVLVAPDWLRERWPSGIGIDVCLALEIQSLWRKGIRTNGHCCGHGRAPAFISVWPEEAQKMLALGYEPHAEGRADHFLPKTKFTTPANVGLRGAAEIAGRDIASVASVKIPTSDAKGRSDAGN